MIILIGQPNVGKSTLFNRLTGSSHAIVSAISGTTLNRKDGICNWLGKQIPVADFIGLPVKKDSPHFQEVSKQVDSALNIATAFLFVLDGQVGLTKVDNDLINLIRKQGKPMALVVNKIDNQKDIPNDLPKGFDNIFFISALHGSGMTDLLDFMASFPLKDKLTSHAQLVFIGRQNVGKSTLFNQLVNQDRSIVSSVPGTTREPIEVVIHRNSQTITFIDTAGIRKPGKIQSTLERETVGAALEKVITSTAVVCLIDASEGPTRQDIHLIEFASKRRKPILIIVNKWDLFENNQDIGEQSKIALRLVTSRFPSLRRFQIIPVSAKTGWNVKKIIEWLQLVVDSFDGGPTQNH